MAIKKHRLVCGIGANALLFVAIALFVLCNHDKGNKYIRFGPNDDLNIMGYSIDSWEKYVLLQVFLAVVQGTDVAVNEIVSPILGFNIYNPDKRTISEFSRIELQVYANTHFMINAMRSALMVIVTISQVDVAILRVLYGEIVSFFTIRLLLNEKTFPGDTDYERVENDGIEMP